MLLTSYEKLRKGDDFEWIFIVLQLQQVLRNKLSMNFKFSEILEKFQRKSKSSPSRSCVWLKSEKSKQKNSVISSANLKVAKWLTKKSYSPYLWPKKYKCKMSANLSQLSIKGQIVSKNAKTSHKDKYDNFRKIEVT